MSSATIEVLAVKYGTVKIAERVAGDVHVYEETWGPGSVAIPSKPVPLFRFHDHKMPVGVLTDFRETAEGLVAVGRLSGSSTLQSDVRAHVADGLTAQASIGFIPSKGDEWTRPGHSRRLPRVNRRGGALHEVSLVESGAVTGSRVLRLEGGATPDAQQASDPAAALTGIGRAQLVEQLKAAEAERDRYLEAGQAAPPLIAERVLALRAEIARRRELDAKELAWLDEFTAKEDARKAANAEIAESIAELEASQKRLQAEHDGKAQRAKVREIVSDRREQGLEPPVVYRPPRTYTEAERAAIRQREDDRQYEASMEEERRAAEMLDREQARREGRPYVPRKANKPRWVPPRIW